ncbi:MFS transporter [Brevibacillus nitrificans]|uniref:MFS transporter n=1 Tax=Brevibacillus nitrificans TaxID=651560 RepID=UPI002E2077C7|nr:MFS transporter [Brevibacillus nitrificans]
MQSVQVLRHPHLRRMLTANLLSGIGDWFNSVAVLSLLMELTSGAMAVGITLALRTLPHLLFGPLGGVLADRWDKKKVMIFCDFARALLALSFLLISSAEDIWLVYLGTFSLVAFSSLYQPSRLSILPHLVEPEELATANALDQSVYGMVMAIGSLIGGIFIALWGSEAAFVYNSLSFLLSGILIMRLDFPHPDRGCPSPSTPQAFYRDVLAFAAHTPIVRSILLMTALWPIGGGIINVLISVYAYQVFQAGEMGIGLFYGAIGVGFILGGLAADRFAKKLYKTSFWSLSLEGVALILTSMAPTIYVAAACYALSTVAGGIGNTSLRTLLMQHVRSDYQGRVFALEATVSNVLIGLSMLAGGWLLSFAEPRLVGFAAGTCVTLFSVVIGWSLWRASRKSELENLAPPSFVAKP